MTSCQNSVKIVSDYCDRHISEGIKKNMIEEVKLIRSESPVRQETIDFFVSYYVMNETEFKNCK